MDLDSRSFFMLKNHHFIAPKKLCKIFIFVKDIKSGFVGFVGKKRYSF